jgi:molecular chaperone IbpA
MTKLTLFPDTKFFDQFYVGFDDVMQRAHKMQEEIAKNVPSYPPYNIKKVDDNKYVIELAVAGFDQQDIEIELADNKLIIKGDVKSDSENIADYLFKGIGMRAFTRTFALSDHIEVDNAELVNGMLRVWLERMIPEHKKPKKVHVNTSKSDKQLLTEEK